MAIVRKSNCSIHPVTLHFFQDGDQWIANAVLRIEKSEEDIKPKLKFVAKNLPADLQITPLGETGIYRLVLRTSDLEKPKGDVPLVWEVQLKGHDDVLIHGSAKFK